MSTIFVIFVLIVFLTTISVPVVSSSSSSSSSSSTGTTSIPNTRKLVQIASPLQSLTIWDNDVKESEKAIPTFRQLFLEKFRTGLVAEKNARDELIRTNKLQSTAVIDASTTTNKINNPSWINTVLQKEQKQLYDNEKYIESAYDSAIENASIEYKEKQIQLQKRRIQKRKSIPKNQQQQYQFVGIINNKKSSTITTKQPPKAAITTSTSTTEPVITWYAREKPIDSTWTIRLVHVNRHSIIKDLFDNGKIDIFASYKNLGPQSSSIAPSVVDAKQQSTSTIQKSNTLQPNVVAEYTIRKKTWKNLWNFSLKHMITDSSGMYWRERRLPFGLYTDGTNVYQSSYRYRDGRNGMHRISTLKQYLNSKSINIDIKTKQQILSKLQTGTPDIVLEE